MLLPYKKDKKIYINSGILIIALALSIMILTIRTIKTTEADRIQRQTCSKYTNQLDAQVAWTKAMKNPALVKYYKQMDGDKDGVVCEHLPLVGKK